ncbi:efflux RND transporter periplasmic adaptor subunit [Flavobacterium psychrotrophum]|uniref:efflux RND transporter periplasmic adaptor subunit n=1 Tax=Flavobacterium psychrotrophum TaxID=2294119 RepID=UPI000E311B1F|nr:efflux RND transporter periplasmic adaptor subunit [Flavobacterium psychrotrophum]
MKKKTIIIIIIVAIVGLIIFQLANNKSKINEKNKPVAVGDISIPVTVAQVKLQRQDIKIIKTGSLAPFKEATVLAPANGNILKLSFALGDQVKKGQLLAVIDTKVLQLDLQKSESNVIKQLQDYETYSELLKGGAATKEKVNEIRQTYQDALNQSQQLKRQISDASIKASTTGVIATKKIEEGVYVTSGAEITTIVNLSQVKVQVNLTEREVYQVVEGQKIKITTDIFPDRIFEGTISYISPRADQTHNYQVEIIAANTGGVQLRPGTFVYADFSRKTSKDIIVIPREALIESTKDGSVYVTKDGKAVLRTITTGADFGNGIEVLTGLEPGEQVITSGQINLKDGAKINISK